MLRACIAIAAVVVVLSGCGGGDGLPDQPAPDYTSYLGTWVGIVDGANAQQRVLSVRLEVSLDGDATSVTLSGLCGASDIDIRAYRQDKNTIYFMGEPLRCAVQTPCGVVDGRVGGIVLRPTKDGRLGVQVTVESRGCDGEQEEAILMSGVLGR